MISNVAKWAILTMLAYAVFINGDLPYQNNTNAENVTVTIVQDTQPFNPMPYIYIGLVLLSVIIAVFAFYRLGLLTKLWRWYLSLFNKKKVKR